MRYQLRKGISFCETGGRILFLDATNDRYFALESEIETVFRLLWAGAPADSIDRSLLDALVGKGLLSRADGGEPIRACAPYHKPSRSLINDEVSVAASAAVAAALARSAASAAGLKLFSLDRSLRRLGRRKAGLRREHPEPLPVLQSAAAAFRRTALVAAPLDRCLPRSLAAAHRLLDERVRPDLVIGVRLGPFAAHAWVQHRDTVVNDALDQVRNFTPILIV